MTEVIKMHVRETIQTGGVTPTGQISIVENGVVNVAQYATANVQVPGVTPTGKITITENGTDIDVSQYATADVAVVGTYTKKGLATYNVSPIDTQYVTDSYKGSSADDTTLANCPSLSTFYSTFYDKYLNANLTNYTVTKKSLGKDQSDTYDLYEYDFCPTKWDRMILLTSGMHGYEVGSIFGLAYFMENIIEHHTGNDYLTYLYEHVRIKVIPIINPWGYSQSPKQYLNSRSVNINRNFDYNGEWENYDPQGNPNNAKGSAPFSEAETKILRHWASDNYGAEFWIDCHTSLPTNDKEIFSSSLTTSPYHSKVQSAHTKLEAWTKLFYNLQTVQTEYRYDSSASLKQRWYEGTYGLPMLVIEQCSDCATIGNTKNGNQASFINYESVLSGYIGEFLLKADETVVSNTYIEELQQEAINNKKYLAAEEEPEPTPEPTTLNCYQGSISGTTGEPTVNATRVYTAEVPISNAEFHVIGFGSGYWFGGRCYDNNSTFVQPVSSENPNADTIAFKFANQRSSSWGIVSDATIVVGANIVSSVKKLRLIIRTEDGTDNLSPSDVVGKEITVDGITYKLAVGT